MRLTMGGAIRSFGRIFGCLRNHSLLYGTGLVMSSGFALLANLLEGQLYGVVADAGEFGDIRVSQRLAALFLLLIGLVVFRGIGQVLYKKAVARGDEELRRHLVHRLIGMPLSMWYRRHSGDWLAVLGKDTDDAAEAYKEKAGYLMGCFLEIAGGGLILWMASPAMAVWGIVAGLGYLWVGLLNWKRMRTVQQRLRAAGAEMTVQLSNQVNGYWISRFYQLSPILDRKFQGAVSEYWKSGEKGARIAAGNSALYQIGYTLSYSGTLLVGLLLVHQGMIGLSDMLAMWPVSMGISRGLQELGFLFTSLQETVAAAERLEEVLDLPQEERKAGEERTAAEEEAPAVELDNVTFTYGQGRKAALKGCSLTVQAGERVAFVGESGSGKTTLAKLLMGFYQPDEGRISVFGETLGRQPLEAVRGKFAYVPQSTRLLDDTIFQNIALVKPGCTREEVFEAAVRSGADSFIRELPEGYETLAGENGSRLSGGQRQWIAIARAFLRDAPALILDEATASLDGRSEAQINQVLRRAGRDKTLLLITHRIQTAAFADRIVVMKDGEIVESGRHEELLEMGGYYRQLWENGTKGKRVSGPGQGSLDHDSGSV